MTTNGIRQSETKLIWRSQINLNPINPKRHNDAQVETQRRNLKKVGFLGGVVWNELSGNLIDGHRRIKAMDIIHKYDGSEATDYEVKVECVRMDDKTEKEQLTYMAVGYTKPDMDLIADYIGEIDCTDVGLSERDIQDILSFNDLDGLGMETIDDLFEDKPRKVEKASETTKSDESGPAQSVGDDAGEDYDARKAHMKEVKAQVKQKAVEDGLNQSAYITLSLSSFDDKSDFCALLGVSPFTTMVKGEEVTNLIS